MTFNAKYLGGIYDGDGTIMIGSLDKGYTLKVSLCQCNVNILFALQNEYGGAVYKRKNLKSENSRREYKHILHGKDCERILNDLEEGCIIKYYQVKLAKEYLQYIGKKGLENIREQYYQKICDLNQKIDYEERPYERVDIDYISGLFDAEGSITIGTKKHKGLRIKITQQNDLNVLYFIQEYFKLGKIKEDNQWVTYDSQNMYKFLIEMNKNLVVKKIQMDALLKFIENIKDNNKNTYNEILHNYRHKLYEIIDKDKHTSIEIEENLLIEYNNKGKAMLLGFKAEKKAEQKKLNREQWLIKISEAKKGEKNPNYGKPLPEQHAKNIAKSKIGKKRKLTDDDINNILANKNKKTHDKLADEYGISRQYIGKIMQGLVKTSNNFEEQIKNNKEKKDKIIKEKNNENYDEFIKHKVSIAKRKLSPEQIIEILKLDRKISSTNINEYINFKDKDDKPITQNVVKNIRSGRTKLFEFEFKNLDITYDEYIKLLDI